MDFTGPAGALVFLGAAVTVLGKVIQELWRDHQRSDQEDRDERDRLLVVVEGLVPTVKELAAGLAESNRNAAERHRRTDDG